MLGHGFSYNVLRRKIYPTLPGPRTYVHYRFSILSARPAGLPNRRDHGSLKASIVCQQLMTLQKKTLLHMVRRAHSSCAPNSIYCTLGRGEEEGGQREGTEEGQQYTSKV